MLWGFIFEISEVEKFLFFIFFLLVLLSLWRIIFIDLFFSRLYFFYFLISILILFNLYICFFIDLVFIIIILIILSFLSLFSVILGFGVSIEVCFIIPFKFLADFFLILYLGFFFFLIGEWEILIWINFYDCFFFGDFFLLLAFSVYSFCGIFGFWIYWAMEGSYFVSSYLHSVGFILISVVIFLKMYYLGILESYYFFIYKLEIFFFFSFIFFLLCFLIVKKIKKCFGYFSCSGVCFVFLILLNSPSIGLIYFIFSSFIKIIFFEVMGCFYKFFVLKSFFKIFIVGRFDFREKRTFFYTYFLSLISVPIFSLIFFIYGEVFYLYYCLDFFLDFYFIQGFFGKMVYIFFFFKFFGVISFLFRLNMVFFNSTVRFFKLVDAEMFVGYLWGVLPILYELEIAIFFCLSFFIYFFIMSVLELDELEKHFLNIFFWVFFFYYFFFNFYKNFSIFVIEDLVRCFLFEFFNFIFFNRVFFNFNLYKKVEFILESRIHSLVGISICFFIIFFLI